MFNLYFNKYVYVDFVSLFCSSSPSSPLYIVLMFFVVISCLFILCTPFPLLFANSFLIRQHSPLTPPTIYTDFDRLHRTDRWRFGFGFITRTLCASKCDSMLRSPRSSGTGAPVRTNRPRAYNADAPVDHRSHRARRNRAGTVRSDSLPGRSGTSAVQSNHSVDRRDTDTVLYRTGAGVTRIRFRCRQLTPRRREDDPRCS